MTVQFFSDRQKRRARLNGGTPAITPLRLAELSRFLLDKYGLTLPDDDAGRDDAFVAANMLARTNGREQAIRSWLAVWAPWMGQTEAAEMAATAMRLQLKWTADKLAQRIGLDYATRTRLGIKTIGATDVDAEQRRAIRAEKDRERKRAQRRKAGANPREAISGIPVSESAPWNSDKISRSTWYERRRRTSVHSI